VKMREHPLFSLGFLLGRSFRPLSFDSKVA
jgi:hypothetical protein